ncbi:MAG: hypothetical protein HYY09_00210 [Firmicutes bacterium]|nr:hypothetical protein [Bacillota bacterium]
MERRKAYERGSDLVEVVKETASPRMPGGEGYRKLNRILVERKAEVFTVYSLDRLHHLAWHLCSSLPPRAGGPH